MTFPAESEKIGVMQNTKSVAKQPTWNEAFLLWLCPTCEVEVTTVDVNEVRACTCCGQKLRKPMALKPVVKPEPCYQCDGDGFDSTYTGSCSRCGGSGKEAKVNHGN